MLDDCIAVALGLPQLKILWQRDKVVFLTLVKRTARKSGKRRGNGGNRGARVKEGRGVSG